jgi:hypothetical protein
VFGPIWGRGGYFMVDCHNVQVVDKSKVHMVKWFKKIIGHDLVMKPTPTKGLGAFLDG